jgi:sarcosine oxidase, subunit alpha
MYRLGPQPREWLDRASGGSFTFEGRNVEFLAGDTYGSALAAAGLLTTARSFKYHRRRGMYSAANHDANNLFQIEGRPNQRGDVLLARNGVEVTASNTSGGVAHDRAAFIERLARFLPVGFYYKTFISRRLFPTFERLIRRFSGLGRIDPQARAEQPAHRFLHCDVAVVGAGATGMSAALAACAAGATRVVLIDEGHLAGGSALNETTDALRARIAATPQIVHLAGHCAFGLYEDLRVGVADATRPEGGLQLLRASSVVLAAGAIEQPIVFRNNDLPGVLLASAAQCLLQRHAVACGRRVVVLTATPEGVAVALDLAAAGVAIAAVACLAGCAEPREDLRAALSNARITLLENQTPVQALAGGDGSVAAVELRDAAGVRRLACDALLLSAGWLPGLQLALQAGGTQRWSNELQQYLPDVLPRGVYVAGRARGVYGLDDKLADGAAVGAAAARGETHPSFPMPQVARAPGHPFPLFPHPRGKEFIDLDEDLTLADLANAVQEGFDSTELLKRYSTVGMGPSQGKLSNLNAARYLAHLRNAPFAGFSLTTARPPYQGITLGALAGVTPQPLRRSALDDLHASCGAQWMPAGAWRRPAWYAVAGKDRAGCIAAEVLAVRNDAGVIDVSTLGKIEVLGPDAGALLESLYTGRFLDQRVGTTRYALMSDEAGMLIDDGVVARFGAEAWYVTATTGAAAGVYREMQRHAIEQRFDVVLHNVTGATAAVNLAGPRCREILAGVCSSDISDASFPYLACRELQLATGGARVLRVGFVGELAYEIHVPFAHAAAVWNALARAAGPHGLKPFGVEAQRVLRLEKGHIIIGQDTDALTSPDEAGLERAVRFEKPFFVGRRSIEALRRRGPRQQLVGFTLAAAEPPFSECNLVIGPEGPAGRITSVVWSPTLGKVIGLALVSPALADASNLRVLDDHGALHVVEQAARPFYDPRNLRQRTGVAA